MNTLYIYVILIGDVYMTNKIIISSIILISLIAKNRPMIIAGIIILLLFFLNSNFLNSIAKNHSLNIGMTFLMIWMLSPLLEEKNSINLLDVKNYFNTDGIISLISGFLVVIVAAKGLTFLNNNQTVLIGVISGSIIGVSFFGGIPVGLLTASGIAYLIIKLIKG